MAGLEGAEISPPPDSNPYHPDRSKSLYGLCYATHKGRYFIRKPTRPFDKVCTSDKVSAAIRGGLKQTPRNFDTLVTMQ